LSDDFRSDSEKYLDEREDDKPGFIRSVREFRLDRDKVLGKFICDSGRFKPVVVIGNE
jgi:hypothetical protein